MTVKLISLFALLLSLVTVQNIRYGTPSGKTYMVLLSETCKEMPDGGCMLSKYRYFNFSKDSVSISYQAVANCTPKEREKIYDHIFDHLTKTYKWTINQNIITIEGFDEYGKFIFQKSKLIGENKIEFNEKI